MTNLNFKFHKSEGAIEGRNIKMNENAIEGSKKTFIGNGNGFHIVFFDVAFLLYFPIHVQGIQSSSTNFKMEAFCLNPISNQFSCDIKCIPFLNNFAFGYAYETAYTYIY